MLRWFVNVSDWVPSAEEFDRLLSGLETDEQRSIQRFVNYDDRRRAFVSRLMQRACVRQVCGCMDSEVRVQRTKGGKPFCTNTKPSHAPNFNFNVSHEARH